MIVEKVFLRVVYSLSLILSLAIIYLYFVLPLKDFYSIALSYIFTTANFFTGIASIKFGIEKSYKIFMFTIIGGKFIRLLLLAGIVFISLMFLELNQNSFIFSILFFFVFYLILEIFYLNIRKR